MFSQNFILRLAVIFFLETKLRHKIQSQGSFLSPMAADQPINIWVTSYNLVTQTTVTNTTIGLLLLLPATYYKLHIQKNIKILFKNCHTYVHNYSKRQNCLRWKYTEYAPFVFVRKKTYTVKIVC